MTQSEGRVSPAMDSALLAKPAKKKKNPLRCVNCSEEIALHVSLTEQFPEWTALTGGAGRSSKKSSEAGMSASTASGASSESGGGLDGNLGDTLGATGNLFDLLAGSRTPLETPMCCECTEKLLDNLDSQLRLLEEEAGDYKRLSASLATAAHSGPDLHGLRLELGKLHSEEAVLKAELERLESEEAEIDTQLGSEKTALAAVASEEERLFILFRDQQRKALELDAESVSMANQLRYAEGQLDKLSKTNVFNLSFHIWHSGHFGTINGFRLGRLPDAQVEWSEINAAWGQTVLLLSCLARKLALNFLRYQLVPFGNYSFIRVLPDPAAPASPKAKELPLYYAGGHKFLGNTKLDGGMLGFLDCLGQLKKELEGHASFTLPYAIAKDKIMDKNIEFSVKIQFNSEERWTKAMKLMLMNLKWALAWIASIHSPSP